MVIRLNSSDCTMQYLLTALIFPAIAIAIGLLLEYFGMQPLKNAILIPRSSTMSRNWATAMRKAVKQFKAEQTGYNWNRWLSNKNNITIEEWEVGRGQAILTLAVSKQQPSAENPIPGMVIFTTERRIIAKYQLVIDRTGDILKMRSVPINIVSPNS